MTTAQEAKEFLARHFGPLDEGMTVEVRAFHAQSRSRSQTWHADFAGAVEMAFGLSPDHDVYFAVNPRWAGKGTKDGVARIICLHADFDYKVFDSKEEAVKALVEFEIEPSAVVDSGGGLHVYWKLATPVANEPSLVNYVEHMMRRLYYRLAPGDDSLDGVQDISRILRVPGTVNHKPAYGGDYPARVLYQGDVAYDLDQFDKVLPQLPERVPTAVANARGGTDNWTTEDVGAMLAHIDPGLPYNDWVGVLMGVHSAFPDQEGFDLCDAWSTATREANGQRSLRNQPEKWAQFRRGDGQRRVSLGTVIKFAMDGGWSPPKGPNMVLRVPSAPADTRAPEWQQLLSAYPALSRDEMPHMLQRLVQYLEPMTINWQEDWAEMLALTGFSLLFPDARFENLGVNLWWLGIAPQGSGKSRSTEEVYRLIRAVSVEGEFGVKVVTSATPEGYGAALNGQSVALLSYHSEYSGFLASLKREHMKGGKDVLCDLYDGSDWVYQRSTETIECISPYLAVIATTTGVAVTENGERKDLQNGYLSRFMFCVPDTYDRDLGVRSDLERIEMRQELLDHALRLRGVRRARFDMPFGQDPPCLTELKRDLGVNSGRVRTFEDDLTTEDLPAGRLLARLKKVATLLEMCEGSPNLDEDDTLLLVREVNVERAIRLVMRGSAYGHRLTRALGNSKDDDTATRVKRCLEKLPRQQAGFGLSMREVMQKTHMNKAQAQTALDILVANFEVEKYEAGKKVMYKIVKG